MVVSKQVKVDNWGIFFLQRLQQFYNKSSFCDLRLKFDDNVQIKVHRLVMNACTEYFQMLEQTCLVEKDCLMMPSNLPSDVVIPIINFMYSGILEFQESSFDRLYSTAKLMNMSVLTKLLDAQKTPIKPITPVPKRIQSVTPITWNLQGKKITTKAYTEPDLPETLPGRKLPIWKRKSIPPSAPYLGSNNYDSFSSKVIKTADEPPKPTRFEWPEEESSFENSFDNISYESKPLILPTFTPEKSPKPSTSSTFEEIKKTAGPVKRSASPLGNQCKKVNIQDVKEYLKEHKIRSDYIDYDDAEMADNDLQTFDDDSNEEHSKDATDVLSQNSEEPPNKSILKNDTGSTHSNKHVRFSLDGKENAEKKLQSTGGKSSPKAAPKPDQNTPDMSKHTKIITEVLKKYPHLVKNNKNIRLKILAKGSNSSSAKSTPAKATMPAKQESKVSYMVVKPDQTQKPQPQTPDKEQTSWECTRCEEPRTFTSYHTYRQHLTEAHNEKQDSQMCIICGHTSRKQNLLVYHKFVKHNIPPPAMFNFPKCKVCSYVALSPIILQKHMASHAATNFTCNKCSASFPNKTALISHLQQMGHGQDRVTPQWGCSFCEKRFFSENILNTHMKRNHEDQMIALNNEVVAQTKSIDENNGSKSKDKIKIISDIKVNTPLPNQHFQVTTVENAKVKMETQAPEHSSEAEALSNVASGIAASLGLVDTIVVLDENQFILQSAQHANIQQNILNSTGNEYILPQMQINEIATSSMNQMSQHPTVTLSSDTNTVLTQSLHKSGITSTDELVMVLTDHDYSDGTSNAVISDNNIVVLYSHPVQTQAGTMMLTSEAGMIEVDKNYAQTIPVTLADQTPHCEESIELIQQEINNQLDTSALQIVQQDIEETTEMPDNMLSHEGHTNDVPEMDRIKEMEDTNEIVVLAQAESIDNLSEIKEIEVYKQVTMEEIQEEKMKGIEDVYDDREIDNTYENSNANVPRQMQETVVNIETENLISEDVNQTLSPIEPISANELESLKEDNGVTIQEYSNVDAVQTEANYENNMLENVPNTISSIECNQQNVENITQIEENKLQVEEHLEIMSQEPLENMPETEENLENMPQVEENLENMPQVEENLENMPQVEENMPQVEENIENMPEVGQNLESISHVEENLQNMSQVAENVEIMPEGCLGQENIVQEELSLEISPEGEKMEIDHGESISENVLQIQKSDYIETVCETEATEINSDETDINTIPDPVELDIQETEIIMEQREAEIHEIQNVIQAVDKRNETEQVTNEDSSNNLEDSRYIVEANSPLTISDQSKNEEIVSSEESILELKAEENVLELKEENLDSSMEIDTSLTQESTHLNLTENESDVSDIINKVEDQSFSEYQEEESNKTEIVVYSQSEVQTSEESKMSSDDGTEEANKNFLEGKANDQYASVQQNLSENGASKSEVHDAPQLVLRNERISKLLDDWDDGDTDSQQSLSKSQSQENTSSSINKLIDDWDDEEDT